MDGARRAGEVEYPVDLDKKRVSDVMAQDLEGGVVHKGRDVFLTAGEEIIEADHLVAVPEQPPAEMGADETRPPVTRTRFLPFYTS